MRFPARTMTVVACVLPFVLVACLERTPSYAGETTGTDEGSGDSLDGTGSGGSGSTSAGSGDGGSAGSGPGTGTGAVTGTGTGPATGTGAATGTETGAGTGDETGAGTGGIEAGLLLHLPLDGDANDASGNGMHGAVVSGSGDEWIAGHVGAQALELDGSDEFVETVDDSWATLVNDYTAALWVNAAPSQQGWSGFYTKGDNDWTLGFNVQGTVIEVGHAGVEFDSGVQLSELTGGWHHVAVVRSAVTTVVYLDGGVKTMVDGAGPRSGPGTLKLGASRDGMRTIEAQLDDFRVYDRALEPDEIQELVEMGG